MTSRPKAEPEVKTRVNALKRALTTQGATPELIAQRAKRLLMWVPSQEKAARMAWLLAQLNGNQGHFNRVEAALNADSAPTPPTEDGSRDRQNHSAPASRRRAHEPRRRSR